jgi:rhodanese-related sulfurtransferase
MSRAISVFQEGGLEVNAFDAVPMSEESYAKPLSWVQTETDSMKTISKDELVAKLNSRDLVIVNVLARPAYEKIRIRGSVSIPRSELEGGRWKELDSKKEIVVHCSSYECGASRMAAEFLEARGFDVKAYEGGIKEWAEAGLPMEGTISPKQYLEERYGKPSTYAAPAR